MTASELTKNIESFRSTRWGLGIMNILIGRGSDLTRTEQTELARYRHRVFVQELGWQLPSGANRWGEERDQFDDDAAIYVIARGEGRGVCGCARLLPTTRPYLLGEVFPGLVAQSALPRCERTFELSRFAARSHAFVAESALERFRAARRVLAHALRAAWECGATQVVGVLTPAIERTCRMLGAHMARLGPMQAIGGERVVACAIDLASEGALLDVARDDMRAISRIDAPPTRATDLAAGPRSGRASARHVTRFMGEQREDRLKAELCQHHQGGIAP